MRKLLYAWEYGSDLGHISVFLPIAKALRVMGYDVLFAIPAASSSINAAIALIERNSFSYIEVPGSSTLVENGVADNHAELVMGLSGFQNESAIGFVVQSWLSVLAEQQPRVLVCDFALASSLAAGYLGIPRVVLDFGFFVPDIELPLPNFRHLVREIQGRKNGATEVDQIAERIALDATERQVLATLNNALVDIGMPPLSCFKEIFGAEKTMWLTYPELALFEHSDSKKFYGAVLNTSDYPAPNWPLSGNTKPKVFAYLKMTTPGVKEILDALASMPHCNVLVYLLGSNQKIQASYSKAHMRISNDLLNFSMVLDAADLVISQAGSGFVNQTLLAGKPLLLAPKYFEQSCNAYRAMQIGAALCIPNEPSKQAIQRLIDNLLGEVSYVAHARAFAYRNRPADVGDIAAAIEQTEKSRSKQIDYLTLESKFGIKTKPSYLRFDDLAIVFVDLGEVNAEANWQSLNSSISDAIRIKADSHRQALCHAADTVCTDRFIVVPANNQVDEQFLKLFSANTTPLATGQRDSPDLRVPAHILHAIWQWYSVNSITGLAYAHNGITSWTKTLISDFISSRSIAPEKDPWLVGFWSQSCYHVFKPSYSSNHTDCSPYQAFIDGFREGALLAYCHGKGESPEYLSKAASNPEVRRLAIWMSVGADLPNGIWSMLGARLGFQHRFSNEFDLVLLSDKAWLQNYWNDLISRLLSAAELSESNSGMGFGALVNQDVFEECRRVGSQIRTVLSKPPVLDMSASESAQFKQALSAKRPLNQSIFSPAFAFNEL